MVGAAHGDISNTERNICGMITGHEYSILAAFTMTDSSSTDHKMVMLRNPWGRTEYNETWNWSDSNWTPELEAQLPLYIRLKW